MVIARLSGGLGNQMFQYALGRHIAFRRDEALLLETSQLRGRPNATPRSYGLDMFNIAATILNPNDLQRVSGVMVTIFQQRDGFHPEALAVQTATDVVLHGFWTSERYFSEIASLIRSDFSFRSDASMHEDGQLAVQIHGSNAVCVHVRRGDYVSTPSHFMGFVGVEYYQRAIDLAAARISNPHFFIFSDDQDWCMANLTVDHTHTFVRHDRPAENATEEDFRLMRMCRHFIIANSTFSWWAAWLSADPCRLVIAPSNWYAQTTLGSYKLDASDLLPSGWIRA
jgi:Glycosyl transferase family 11